MNNFVTFAILITIGSSVASLAIDEAELIATREALVVDAQCTHVKCHGDFPVLTNRKYAERGGRSERSGLASV